MNDLTAMASEVEANARNARAAFGDLTREQLNWKPAADRWSVAQCLEHLMVIESGYLPVFERIERGEFRESFVRRLMFPGWMGRMILKAVQPQAPKAFKTSKAAEPTSGDLGADIVDRFEAHNRTIAEHARSLGELDAGHLVIPSPVFPIGSYSVRDALRILVAHQRRHIQQAQRVMQTAGFPAPKATRA